MQGNLFYQLEYLGLIAFIYVLCLYHHNKQPILYVHFTFFFPLNPKRYSGFFSKFWQCFLIVREIFLCFYTSLVEECFDLSRSLIAFYGMVPLCNQVQAWMLSVFSFMFLFNHFCGKFSVSSMCAFIPASGNSNFWEATFFQLIKIGSLIVLEVFWQISL